MKTDELIAMLAAANTPVDPAAPRRRTLLALALALPVSVLFTVAVLGVRPALGSALLLPAFWVRELFCAAVSAAAALCAVRLAHPGCRLGRAPLGVIVPVLVLWLLAVVLLAEAPPPARASLLLGQTALVCPWLIALVSAPLFFAFLWLTRQMAPTRLRLAGAAAGLAAGALGALVYTLHCPELAPSFLAIWYVLGMLLPALAGALLGPRVLRW